MFCFINKDLEDDFVIRLKSSRIDSLSKIVNDDRVIRKKLIDKSFVHKSITNHAKIRIKNQIYQQAKSIIEWVENIDTDNVVRIKLLN